MKQGEFFYALISTLSVFICSCTQVALKKNADKDYRGLRVYLNAPVLISNMIFVGATVLSLWLYKYISLSTGAVTGALTFVFTPLLSGLFLKEKMSTRIIIGSAMIATGIAAFAFLG